MPADPLTATVAEGAEGAERPGGPSRRTVVRAAATGLVGAGVLWGTSGCRLRIGSPAPAPSDGSPGGAEPPGAGAASQTALDLAATSAQQLQALYARAAVVRPDLAGPLARLVGDHSAHLRALEAVGASPSDTAVPTSTVSPSVPASSPATTGASANPSPTTTTPGPTGLTAANAVSVLAQAERLAGATQLQQLATVDARTARLLASIAACSSVHVALLARLPSTPSAKAGG